jgi:hypothetical protein
MGWTGRAPAPNRSENDRGLRLVGQRTAVINQIRGFLLEHGIAVRQGLRFLRQQLPDILAIRAASARPKPFTRTSMLYLSVRLTSRLRPPADSKLLL